MNWIHKIMTPSTFNKAKITKAEKYCQTQGCFLDIFVLQKKQHLDNNGFLALLFSSSKDNNSSWPLKTEGIWSW